MTTYYPPLLTTTAPEFADWAPPPLDRRVPVALPPSPRPPVFPTQLWSVDHTSLQGLHFVEGGVTDTLIWSERLLEEERSHNLLAWVAPWLTHNVGPERPPSFGRGILLAPPASLGRTPPPAASASNSAFHSPAPSLALRSPDPPPPSPRRQTVDLPGIPDSPPSPAFRPPGPPPRPPRPLEKDLPSSSMLRLGRKEPESPINTPLVLDAALPPVDDGDDTSSAGELETTMSPSTPGSSSSGQSGVELVGPGENGGEPRLVQNGALGLYEMRDDVDDEDNEPDDVQAVPPWKPWTTAPSHKYKYRLRAHYRLSAPSAHGSLASPHGRGYDATVDEDGPHMRGEYVEVIRPEEEERDPRPRPHVGVGDLLFGSPFHRASVLPLPPSPTSGSAPLAFDRSHC